MYARYSPGQVILGRRVGNMSVAGVQQLDVTVYSSQSATTVRYVYQGPAKDKKIAEKCKSLKLSGRYQPFASGLLSDTQRGVRLTLDGVPYLGKCRVDVTFRPTAFGPDGAFGADSPLPKSWFWEFDSWKKGEEKRFETPAGELTFDPERITVVITFPGTSYRYEAKLRRDFFNRQNLNLVPDQTQE